MITDNRINNDNFHQLRFLFRHPEFGNVEVFATIPKDTKQPSIDSVIVHSAGIEGDLHADAGDIHESDLALMKKEALRFLQRYRIDPL